MRKTSIRQLKPGEALPQGEPKRYVSGHGYIRVRWRIGVETYVETYEHRIDGDRVTTAEHVHHLNHRKVDNSPTNLEPLTLAEHSARHGSPVADECIRLYRQGHGTPYIGAKVGRDKSAVYRILQRRGLIEPRPRNYRYQPHSDIHANPEQARREGWLTFRRDIGGAA